MRQYKSKQGLAVQGLAVQGLAVQGLAVKSLALQGLAAWAFGLASLGCSMNAADAENPEDEQVSEFEADAMEIFTSEGANDMQQSPLVFREPEAALSYGMRIEGRKDLVDQQGQALGHIVVGANSSAVSTDSARYRGTRLGGFFVLYYPSDAVDPDNDMHPLFGSNGTTVFREENGVVIGEAREGSIRIEDERIDLNVSLSSFRNLLPFLHEIPVTKRESVQFAATQDGLGRLWDSLDVEAERVACPNPNYLCLRIPDLTPKFQKSLNAGSARLSCNADRRAFNRSAFRNKACELTVYGDVVGVEGLYVKVQSVQTGEDAREAFESLPGEGDVRGFESDSSSVDAASWVCRRENASYRCVATAWTLDE